MKFPEIISAALIDMDGVLYDSMPRHARAWQKMMALQGVSTTADEFFLYEGMTGPATIDLIFGRELHRHPDAEECRRLYAIKGKFFEEQGEPEVMPGAARMLRELKRRGVRCILVTGSAQRTTLDRLDRDFPGVFAVRDRITALDVTHGKPDPEPYLKGLEKAGTRPEETIVIENAPLGVHAGKAAGLFTVAVTTGPIPREAFVSEKADAIFPSMPGFADFLKTRPL